MTLVSTYCRFDFVNKLNVAGFPKMLNAGRGMWAYYRLSWDLEI